MGREAVFAYGSLVSRASIASTLGREAAGVWPATLPGWRRRFSLMRDNRRSEKTFALANGSIPDWVLSLNLEQAAGEVGSNGALIEVSADELLRLDRRELRYDRVDVTAAAIASAGTPAFDRVHTFSAKPENLAPDGLSGAVVLRSYVAAVEAAFAELGQEDLDAYIASTEAPAADVVEARLVRDQIPPGNPREW